VFFTVEQGIALLDKLIWHLETYDIISVEQVCQCIFCQRQSRNQELKLLSGEGADEILVICILEMPSEDFKRNN
jgi:asparagine synthase (glutamine-hydrolysing)